MRSWENGYQPKGEHKDKPPTNPPNQGTSGRKDLPNPIPEIPERPDFDPPKWDKPAPLLLDELAEGDPWPSANWPDGVKASTIITDDADWKIVLIALWQCANAWEGDARLVGNVRARDIAKACEKALNVGDQLDEVHQWMDEIKEDNG